MTNRKVTNCTFVDRKFIEVPRNKAHATQTDERASVLNSNHFL